MQNTLPHVASCGRMTKNSRNAALQRLWDTMQEQKLVADGEQLALIA